MQLSGVSSVDLRLLSKIPKPLSADQIYAEFDGRISHEDAQALSLKAEQTYVQIEGFCEQHAEVISFLSTNATYGDQYSQALSALLDPTLSEASARMKLAGATEMSKLKQIAASAKQTLEEELLDGKDASTFVAQAAKVLSQLKNSHEVKALSTELRTRATSELSRAQQRMKEGEDGLILTSPRSAGVESQQQQRIVVSQVLQILESKMREQQPNLDAQTLQTQLLTKFQKHEGDILRAQEAMAQFEQVASAKLGVSSLTELDPMQLLSKAEEILPQVSAKASVLVTSGEKYWTSMQQTTQGQQLLSKAKKLVASVENPDAFCENVTKAIAEVKLENLASWGSTITTNKQKRQEFIDRVKDHCLDFFMSVLPSIKVDTISGVEEGIEYSIAKLDLSNFRVRKERVKVRMGTVVDEELFTVRATHLTALLKGFEWTFAQKYFPYVNGGGLADAELSGGVISLGFKAEKKIVDHETGEFKPTLVLNSMEIEIRDELKITVQGSWFSAIYNMLASVFAALIREYLAKTMESKLLGHMIRLLKTLNDQMDNYWPLILQLLDVRVEDLPPASPWRGAKEVDIQPQQMDISFSKREGIPFVFARGVLNKYVVVSRILDLEMSNGGANAADLLKVPVGSSALAINGFSCSKLTLGEFNDLLQTLPLPYNVRFTLAAEDPARTRQQRVVPRPEVFSVVFRQEGPFGLRLRNRPLSLYGAIVLGFTASGDTKSAAEQSGKIQPGQLLTRMNDTDLRFKKLPEILTILKAATKRPVTLHFASSPDGIVKVRHWPPMIELEVSDEEAADGRNYVVISAFSRVPSFAQKSHVVHLGDVLLSVNGMPMHVPHQSGFAAIMETLRRIAETKQPMHAIFVNREQYLAHRTQLLQATTSPTSANEKSGGETEKEIREPQYDESLELKEVVFPKAPLGILFGNWKDEAAYVRQFISSAGPAEKTGMLRTGHAVLQICGMTVDADATPASIEQMIEDVSEAETPPTSYTITVRDLEVERELMK